MNTSDLYLNVTPTELLVNRGSAYSPDEIQYNMTMARARPIFNYVIIDEMVMDPRVMFGLQIIKGPLIAKAKFGVKCDDPTVTEFIIDQVNRFWNRCATQVLEGIEWGFSSHEVLYEKDPDGRIVLKGLNSFKSKDVRIITKKGVRAGIIVENIRSYGYTLEKMYFGGPKHFHYVHWRKHNKHYGRSRLWGVLIPFWEMWCKNGYRDIRRLWFGKNAYQGGMVRYPKGTTNVPGRGMVDNHVLALEMATKLATGGVIVAPSSRSGQLKDGEWDWMFDPAKANSIPSGLLEYGALLRIEVLEALGIPYEVVEASGNEGFGSSSGRSIPLEVYYSILHEISQDIVRDFAEQIMNTLIYLNFKKRIPYDIIPMPIQSNEQDAQNPSTNSDDDKEQGIKEGTPSSNKSKSDEVIDDEEDNSEEDDLRNDKRKGVAVAL